MGRLLHLPQELLLDILKFLTLIDLLNVAKTCTLLYRLAYDGKLHRHFQVDSQKSITDKELEQFICRIKSPKIEILDLSECKNIHGTFSFSLELLSLHRLDLSRSFVSNKPLAKIWNRTSHNLKELVLIDCENLSDNIVTYEFSEHRSLEVLQLSEHLSADTLIYLVKRSPNIHTVDAEGIILTVSDLKQILVASHLKCLYVPYSLICDDDLEDLIPLMIHMKHLCISETDVTSEGVDFLYKNLHDLVSIIN